MHSLIKSALLPNCSYCTEAVAAGQIIITVTVRAPVVKPLEGSSITAETQDNIALMQGFSDAAGAFFISESTFLWLIRFFCNGRPKLWLMRASYCHF